MYICIYVYMYICIYVYICIHIMCDNMISGSLHNNLPWEECNVHCLGGISHAVFSDSSTNVQQGPHLGKAGKETQGIQIQS